LIRVKITLLFQRSVPEKDTFSIMNSKIGGELNMCHTCVAKEFLKLISKHFKKGTALGKILNRSTVKAYKISWHIHYPS
jgi:hypothetical protein